VKNDGLGGEGGWEGEWPEMPEMRAVIHHLRYRGKAINTGEYRVDGFRNMRVSNVDEFYFLCPECGKVLFNDIEAADKFLKGQPIREDEIYPEDY
jgi:hypothetical protein